MGPSPDQKRSPRIQTRSRYLGTRSNSVNSQTNNSSSSSSNSCSSRSRPRNKHFGKANSQGFRQQGTSSSQVFRLAEVSIPPVRLSAASNSRALGSLNKDSVANSRGFRQQGTSSSQVFRLAEVSVAPVRLSAASNSRALGSLNRDSVANNPQACRVRRSLLAASLESRPTAVKNR